MIITEFVLARIAEDEAAAQAALDYAPDSGLWEFDEDLEAIVARTPTGDVVTVRGGIDIEEVRIDSRHMARWSPVRALAECAAKRTIVEAFEELGKFLTQSPDSGDGVEATGVRDLFAGLMIAVKAHAEVYADHSDYRAEWRSEA
ncbi:DUF6221 family protein [Promicromonospora sp. NPDC023805]|uniref:DUF6221 family protein n=1 Tax=Promicromonospora sp. NPDC023805 TaxID=3154696 RepID=UPI0033F00500